MIYYKLVLIAFATLLGLQPSAQVVHSLSGDKFPWTALPEVKGKDFRFIILPDRTGGEQKGVFDAVIERLNSELPDFYVTIGDVIDGYTQNPDYLDGMWKQHEKSISKLKSPIFYTVGNHDISNTMMNDAWQSKFGHSYYHFLIGQSLFLILNTEDGGSAGISKTQADYFMSVLKQYASGRNIFVFMHRPFWKEKEMMGYEDIDAALLQFKKQTTIFCGHEHRYMKIIKSGIPHYMVATLGGGSQLRGVPLGEFNHYMIVDIKNEDINIRNVLNTGEIIPDDVVNNDNINEVEALSMVTWLKVEPTVSEKQLNKKLPINIILTNTMNSPLKVNGQLPKGQDYYFLQDKIDRITPPNVSDTISIDLYGQKLLDLSKLQNIGIELKGSYTVQHKEIFAEAKVTCVLDYIRHCNYKPSTISCSIPGYIKEDWDWKGAQDGKFDFTIRCTPNKLYLDIRTSDDKLIINRDPQALQDKLYVQYSDQKDNSGNYAYWMLTSEGQLTELSGVKKYEIEASCKTDGNSLVASVVLPLSTDADKIRLNIGFMDHDNPLNTKPSILWWKPLWGTPGDYNNSGIFRIRK